jgi:segregation and condensation protein B
MFMRYLGGGVGHQSVQQCGIGAEEMNIMDTDEMDADAEEGLVVNEGNHLEQGSQWGGDDGEEDEDDDEDEDEDDEDEDEDEDEEELAEEEDSENEDEDEDLGPEDGEDEDEPEEEYDDL